jgi:branched-chain amino acid transport system permease protein
MRIFYHSVGYGIVTASLLAIAAVGLSLQYGVTNFANLSYSQYMTVGAFLAWEFNVGLHMNFWLAVCVASIAVGVLSVVTGRVVFAPFQRRGATNLQLVIASFVFATAAAGLMAALWGTEPRGYARPVEHPHTIGPLLLTTTELQTVAVAGGLLVMVHILLSRTRLGKAMRALSDDKSLARLCGVPTQRVSDVAWGISGVLASCGGIALALSLGVFNVGFGLSFLFVILCAVVVGGIGRPYGTMVGALVVGVAVEVSTNVIPAAYKLDVAFVILVVFLIFRPGGISQVARRI